MSSTSPPRSAAAIEDPAQPVLDWWVRMLATEPVHRDEQGVWHVFRHADVSTVLADPATFSSDTSSLVPDQEDLRLFSRGNIVAMDPPRHREVRTLVNQAFTPRVVAGLEPRIAEVTTTLLDEVADRDSFDLVDALAYPLPVTVIAELLGVPAQDLPLFRRWAQELFSVQATDATVLPAEDRTEAVAPVMREMNSYLLHHIRDRRAHPAGDLLGRLTTSRVHDEGLLDEEIVGLAGVLLLAGHITTTALLGNAILSFDRHPQAEAEVRADRSLLPAAIEEVLRHRTPFPRLGRMTTTDVELGGRQIPARAVVIPWVGAANRDPRRHPDPRGSTSTALPVTWPSGTASTSASARRSPGWRPRVALAQLLDRYGALVVDHEHTRHQNPWVMSSLLSLPVHGIPAWRPLTAHGPAARAVRA